MHQKTIEELGAGIWFMLHFHAARVSTPARAREFHALVYDLAIRFPCPECGQHFVEYLAECPLPSGYSVTEYSEWVYKFHCRRNAEAKPPRSNPPKEEVFAYYLHLGDPAERCDAICT